MIDPRLLPALGLLALALLALVVALVVWIVSRKASRGLKVLEGRLAATGESVPESLQTAGLWLVELSAQSEHVLWQLGQFDERVVAARVGFAEQRAQSDTLRLHIVRSHDSLVSWRKRARLVLRAIELRRQLQG